MAKSKKNLVDGTFMDEFNNLTEPEQAAIILKLQKKKKAEEKKGEHRGHTGPELGGGAEAWS